MSSTLHSLGQTLATFEAVSGTTMKPLTLWWRPAKLLFLVADFVSCAVVMAMILRDYNIQFATGYLENVEMVQGEKTPRYVDSITLPMVCRLSVSHVNSY